MGGDGWLRLGRWSLFGCLIGYFVLILSLCIFLKMLRCQLVSCRQKSPPLCTNRIVAALFGYIVLFWT